MSKVKFYLLSALVVCFISTSLATAQKRVSVGFWNVENLYDTIPALYYDDGDFTPRGKMRWNNERYWTKVKNVVRVIDDAGFDVIGFAEVENEYVMYDIARVAKDDYNYICFNSSDRRGMSLGLLYKGDKFFPGEAATIPSRTPREFLHVPGKLAGEQVDILVCHLPSKSSSRELRDKGLKRLTEVADSLQKSSPNGKLILMGDFNCAPTDIDFKSTFGPMGGGFYTKSMLYEAVQYAEGTGSYVWDSRWMLYDNILLSPSMVFGDGLLYDRGGIFVRDYMLSTSQDKKGHPLRTFTNGKYTVGYSDHLPVFATFSYR